MQRSACPKKGPIIAMLRSTILPALAVTAACAVTASFTAGVEGVWGALAGGLMVCVFFASSPMVLGPIAKVSPQLSLAVAMTFFMTKVIALVALMSVLLDANGLGQDLDRRALGLTVIVTTLAWTFLQIRAAKRQRLPMYDLGNDAP